MLLGLLLIAVAAVSWGTTGATMTLLSREAAASPLLVGWSRLATPLAVPAITFALAAAFLAPALLVEPAPAAALAAGWPLLAALTLLTIANGVRS